MALTFSFVGLLGSLFLVGSIAYTHAFLRFRYWRSKQNGTPEGPKSPLPPRAGRTMEGILGKLGRVPFEPAVPAGLFKAVVGNSFLLALNAARATSGLAYPYPPGFEDIVIESFDGTPVSATVGIHSDGLRRPCIVMCHGLLGSKNDHYIIDPLLVAFTDWGFNVMGVDLRNFGRSQSLAHAPTTAGWKEAEDLLAAAKYMSERPEVTSVGVAGWSMGAGSAMRAAFDTARHPYITGGVIALNGYADSRRMVEYISNRPPVNRLFFPIYLAYRMMLKIRFADMKSYADEPREKEFLSRSFREMRFTDYIDEVAAPSYGVSPEELYASSSPNRFLADVEVPLLVVHALNDPVCPASEMEELKPLVRDNPNVAIWMMPNGSHCLYQYYDRKWFDTIMCDFFTYWATWE